MPVCSNSTFDDCGLSGVSSAVKRLQLVKYCSSTIAVQWTKGREESIKLHNPVSYPLFLDISGQCSPDLKARNGGLLTLSGVLVHQGPSAREGHYFGFFKQPSQRWICCTDRAVWEVSEREVCGLNSLAYMLLYEAVPEFQSLRYSHLLFLLLTAVDYEVWLC